MQTVQVSKIENTFVIDTVMTQVAYGELPLYNATDWHCMRFRVCGILRECVNDSLEQIAE